MKTNQISDLYLMESADGTLIYIDRDFNFVANAQENTICKSNSARPSQKKLGLGLTTAIPNIPPSPPPAIISPSLASNIAAATNVINTAASAIPQQNIQIQTEFSKVANKVASIAGTVASIGAVVAAVGGPVGVLVGGAVAVVGGIVAAVAALLGKIFARAKSKELDAQRAQWDALNAQLKTENSELDLKYENLKANMATLRVAVSKFTGIDFSFGKDNSVQGLGLCIFNCKKKAAEQNLNTSKQQNESLKKAQAEKIALIQELLKEWDTLTAAVIDLNKKGNNNAALIIGFGLAAAAGVYMVAKK